MYEQVEKTEKKRHMAANAVSQTQNDHAPTSRIVDHRPEAIQMRKLRELAKHSPQNAKLRELHNLSAARSVDQKESNGKQCFSFMDNRPESKVVNLDGTTMQLQPFSTKRLASTHTEFIRKR